MVVIKNLEDDHRNQETELLNDKCELKSQIRELQEIHLDQIRTINLVSIRYYHTFDVSNIKILIFFFRL